MDLSGVWAGIGGLAIFSVLLWIASTAERRQPR
jgi:hypothetical protein